MPDAPPAQYTPLYRACIEEAATRGRFLMERLVDSARKSLHAAASAANDTYERTAMSEALRLLNKHESAMVARYSDLLLEVFTESSNADKARHPANSLSFDELELMDEAQVQETVEVARAQQMTSAEVDAQLAVLNALICAAQGLKTVQADRNPLRPEAYMRALRSAVSGFDVAAAVRVRWLHHLGEALVQELGTVYAELSAMLRTNGVTAAAYTVTQSIDTLSNTALGRGLAPGQGGGGGTTTIVLQGHAGGSGAAPGSGAPASAGNTAKGSGGSQKDILLTVNQLRRLLAGELDPNQPEEKSEASFAERFRREFESSGESHSARPEFNPTVPAAFEALQEMKQVDQVMKRLAERNKAGPAADRAAAKGQGGGTLEQLRRQAKGVGQSLGLEVVNLMVENIASDARLLPPVQQAVREVEPALLRLALIDPRFFSDKQHPARRLLEQMTQRSLAWESVDAPGFKAFMEPLGQAVEVLSETPIEGAEPFEFALKVLEEAWGEQQRRERRQREKAMQALLHAEQRNLLADKIASEIQARPDAAVAPRFVVRFLCGPWAQVLAQARLTDQSVSVDPGGYRGLVTDLLWSSLPDLTRNNPGRLTRLIPQLLAKLREGLKRIDYPQEKTAAFFDELMALHQEVLKPAGGDASSEAPRTRAQLDVSFGQDDAAGPWLAPVEAQHSGFMDTRMEPLASSHFQSTRPPLDSQEPPPHAATVVPVAASHPPTIAPGAWVELFVHRRWVRSQLTWASPHGTLFMFNSAGGANHSMTRQTLDQMLANGEMRLISSQAVVDGALDAVAQTAMRNSVDVLKP
ncbi:MAG: DUF1631 family protein [Hydrogenophaga sp.]|uniref:DUF1631 family protein n=1 Tax=Hydrogenophaga sp. TaxID=1904254 RepID=UPI0027215FC3|nr:DUF1631 family protein [Hydrogenophaga sp.]MDO9030913.1 DUF1631 family protein [Hydrogenophaga sp.]